MEVTALKSVLNMPLTMYCVLSVLTHIKKWYKENKTCESKHPISLGSSSGLAVDPHGRIASPEADDEPLEKMPCRVCEGFA